MVLFPKFRRRRWCGSSQSGYILVTLMMIAALTLIALSAAIPAIKLELRRDQEEELIHRGVQYSRAIRRYFKRFGRYPVSLDDLQSTNNMRFLRKRYKDPVTGQDFKLLHFGEVKMMFGPAIAGRVAPGTNATDGPNTDKNASNTQGQTGTQSSSSSDQSSSTPTSSDASSSSSTSSNNRTFGGGPIVGVVSTSTKESIREFNKKNHYNDWQFIYDPSLDRGGLLNTPAQPPLQGPGTGPGHAGSPQEAPGLTAPPGVQLPPQQQPQQPPQ